MTPQGEPAGEWRQPTSCCLCLYGKQKIRTVLEIPALESVMAHTAFCLPGDVAHLKFVSQLLNAAINKN